MSNNVQLNKIKELINREKYELAIGMCDELITTLSDVGDVIAVYDSRALG